MKPVAIVIYVIVGVVILGFGANYLHGGDHSWRPWLALAIGAYFLFRAYAVSRQSAR